MLCSGEVVATYLRVTWVTQNLGVAGIGQIDDHVSCYLHGLASFSNLVFRHLTQPAEVGELEWCQASTTGGVVDLTNALSE